MQSYYGQQEEEEEESLVYDSCTSDEESEQTKEQEEQQRQQEEEEKQERERKLHEEQQRIEEEEKQERERKLHEEQQRIEEERENERRELEEQKRKQDEAARNARDQELTELQNSLFLHRNRELIERKEPQEFPALSVWFPGMDDPMFMMKNEKPVEPEEKLRERCKQMEQREWQKERERLAKLHVAETKGNSPPYSMSIGRDEESDMQLSDYSDNEDNIQNSNYSEDEGGWSDCSADGCWYDGEENDIDEEQNDIDEDEDYAWDLRTLFGDHEHPMLRHGQLDGAASTSSSDGSVVVDDPPAVQKKSKKNRPRRKQGDPELLVWDEHHPVAFRLDQTAGKDMNAIYKVIKKDTGFENSKFAKVIDPKPGYEYIFTGVEEEDVTFMMKRDLYKWRFQGSSAHYYEGLKRANYYASTCISETHTTLFKKTVFYDPLTKKAHVRYDGDDKWGFVDPKMEMKAEEHELPTGVKVEPHPNQCAGVNLKKYTPYYNNKYPPSSIPPTQNIPISDPSTAPVATVSGQSAPPVGTVSPPGTATGAAATSSDGAASDGGVSDATQPKTSSSDEGLTTSKAQRLRKAAHPLHTADNLDGFSWTSKSIVSLKDRIEDIYSAPNVTEQQRKYLWEDVTKTGITFARGGEVYYRDYSNQKTCVYGKEKADGYNWNTVPKKFIAENRVLLAKSIYRNPDKTSNPNFARYQYFFIQEQKLITHYVGDHTVAVERPHGNATISTNPFMPSSADVLTNLSQQSRREAPSTIYHSLTSQTQGGPLALIDLPRNTKQVRNVRAAATRKISSDLMHNAHLVNAEIKTHRNQGNFIRKINTFDEDAYFMIGIDDDIREEVKSFIRRREDNEPPIIFMYDTSFNAGGTGSQCLVSHLILEHDDVVTPGAGRTVEAETASSLILSTMVHQRKTLPTHTEHINTVDLAFDLSKTRVRSVVVSDKEFENLRLWDGAQHALCWMHIQKDIVYHVKPQPFNIRLVINSFNSFTFLMIINFVIFRNTYKKVIVYLPIIMHTCVFCFRQEEEHQQIKNDVHALLVSRSEETYLARRQALFDGEGHHVWTDPRFQNYFLVRQVRLNY